MCPSFFHRRLNKSCNQLLFPAFLILLLLPNIALAGHYFIQDLPKVIDVKYHKAILDAGVKHSGQLYDRIAAKKRRAAFARKSGLAPEQLVKWARFIDLMQLDGIGPKMVRLLNAAGVETLKDFKRSKAAALYKKIRLVNRGGRYSQVVPGVDVLKAWIKRARRTKNRLQ